MTSPNLFTKSAVATTYSAVSANPEGAAQTEGQALYQQASQSPQPEAVVKRQFEQRNRDQKTQLANQFIESAGREGINNLAATPDGQHALAVIYEHAGGEARDLVRQVHEEQGNTAVDYSSRQNSGLDDPLGVSDTGVKIGPRINGFQYTAMTAGVVYGLAENTVMGLVDMGKTVCKESEELKNVDNLEFLDIDSTGQKSDSPGLSLPSWEDIGAGLKRNIQATNQAIATAKQQGGYFEVGKAISNDAMLQMTGLGDVAVFGSLARMRTLAKLESLATDTPRKLGGGAEAAGDGKLSSIDGNKVSEADGGVGANSLSDASVRSEIVGPNNGFARFTEKYDEHIVYRDYDVPRKRGIGGAHNRDEFLKYSNEYKIEEVVPHPSVDGVKTIRYRMTALDPSGNPTGSYRAAILEKTVYDPKKISNEQFMDWGRQAAAEAQAAGKLNREWVGTAPNGLEFRGYLDDTGAVKSFFPNF